MPVTPQKIIQFIEIDVDYCSLTYSVPPCQARLDTDADAISSFTKLLIKADGNSPGNIVDVTTPPHAATVNGNATASTTQFVYGGASLSLDGTGDFVTFANNADWEFGFLDFTVDWWERRTSSGVGRTAVSRDATTTFVPFIFGYDDGAGGLDVYMTSDGANWNIASAQNLGTYSLNVWSHRAVVRSATNFYAFKDGVLQSSWSSSSAVFPNSNPLSIGRTQGGGDFAGFMDEVRITKGKALWTSNFIPPQRTILPFTGTKKCFNTLRTCQDRENFNNAPETLRFAVPTEDVMIIRVLNTPNIKSIVFDPATVSLGQNLGQRATLTVTFGDHRHSDAGFGFDKYYAERPYDPYHNGTFWGKFRARQTFLRGRPLRWKIGHTATEFQDILDALAEMETRHFIIESFSGPDNDGNFKIVAKDLLKLADGDRALAPAVSEGFLVADITNVATTMTLSPTGIAATYPNSGHANIGGSEIVSYTHSGSDSFTKLLLHCDGADASTTFTDASPSARGNATVNGNAQVDTAQSKFGGASLLLDGTGDFLTFPNSADFEFGAGDFTVDWWERRDSSAGSRTSLCRDATTLFPPWIMGFSDTANLRLYITSNGVTSWDIADAVNMGSIELNSWHHFAIVRSGNVFYCFKDGLIQSTFVSDKTILANSNPLSIGQYANASGDFSGWMDEIRITKGKARWTSPFIPPAIAYATASDVMTIVRGQLGTTASSHNTQDRVQHCLRYPGTGPDDIIFDLLRNFAGADAIYLPLADWANEVDSYLNRVYTATIAQPTAVNTLISELIEQAGLSMWWDDRNEEVGLLVLRGLIYSNYFYTQENMQADTLQVVEQPDKRLSQVHTYFGQINPITSLTDKANYRSVSKISDLQAEEDYGSAAIKEIFSRWIPNLGRSVADRLGQILLARFKDPPRKISFSVLRNSVPEVILANGYQVSGWPLQEDTGDLETVNVQVTRMRPNPDLIELETEEVIFPVTAAEDLNNRSIIVDANSFNINLRAAHDLIYPPPTAGINVVFTVNSGVNVGSTSSSTYSLDVGTWPVGVNIIVNIIGRIQGKGGGGAGYPSAYENMNGGPAIFTRFAIKLACSGQIYGGGGGGGIASYNDGSNGYYWGGGGGAGFNVGLGGPSGLAAGPTPGQNGTTEAGGAGFGYGGHGGGPGAGGGAGSVGGGPGGAAGAAIDGVSFCTKGTYVGGVFTAGSITGTILGAQIN